ncbi:MAG: tRNA guanosine(34) transglycosylase Tgt [Dehalococcoidia bacterium]|nr:tRNA guanosine(34) transglycosylase Tgt [Dehalococcoidia bacterium]
MQFTLESGAGSPVGPRLGRVETAHGTIRTPVFMPVGTQATVKSLLPSEVRAAGVEILLVNAFHLYLRPGHRRIERLGGVHRFMGWDGPILSDSGGFQVFSLARLGKVSDAGLRVRSPIDGSPHDYTPELAMEVQRGLGVDIAMPLDHLVSPEASAREHRDAAERTIRWYERCRISAEGLTTFAIVQGGTNEELRRWHARELAALDAPGYSIGGLSVGESKEAMWAMTAVVNEELPEHRPRYLMGVGSPEDLIEAVAHGVDMFDCVLPTRLGRNGAMFTRDGRVHLRNARFKDMEAPVDAQCDMECCTGFSAAYLHHLFKAEEMLGPRLASLHNIRFLVRLIEDIRAAIAAGSFESFRRDFLERYRPANQQVRAEQRARWDEAAARRAAHTPGQGAPPG